MQPDREGNTDACVTRIISALARQAYRRPVTSDDARHLMRLFKTGRKAGGDFDAGIRLVIQALLWIRNLCSARKARQPR